MKTAQGKTGFGKLKATYALLGLAAVVALGSYGWHLYALYQAWQRDTPQPQVERLIRDLRRYHAEAKHFPASFHEINARLWHTRPSPDYGMDGRQARVKNYLYRYTQVEADKCVLWALPVGPKREYGAAFFVVLTPTWVRGWKGKALSDEAIGTLPRVPAPELLANLEMREVNLLAVKTSQTSDNKKPLFIL